MNIDMRNNWRICGNQPGEPPEVKELGIKAPAEGLYLREDIEIKCNVTMVSFVKSQMKSASKVMVDRMIKKAELLDAGVLQAMFDNGRLKTVNPADRSSTLNHTTSYHQSISPRMSYQSPFSPSGRPYSPNDIGRISSWGPGQSYQPKYQDVPVAMELPGDFYHPSGIPEPPPSAGLHPSASLSSHNRYSQASSTGSSPDPANISRWSNYESASSRPTSYTSDTGLKSPGLDQKGFAAELPTHRETQEEHVNHAALSKLEGRDSGLPPYNPADYGQPPVQSGGGRTYEKGGPNMVMP